MNELDKLLLKQSNDLCSQCKGKCLQELPYLRYAEIDGKLVTVECYKRPGVKYGGLNINLYNDLYVNDNRKPLLDYVKLGKSTYIHGDSSVGKTYILANIAKYWLKKSKNVYIDLAINIQNDIKKFDDNKNLLTKLQTIEILCIDDLGSGAVSEYDVMSILSPLLQHRLDNQLTTYITTNYSRSDLIKILAKKSDTVTANRLDERLRDEKNIKIFELKDKNYRR